MGESERRGGSIAVPLDMSKIGCYFGRRKGMWGGAGSIALYSNGCYALHTYM